MREPMHRRLFLVASLSMVPFVPAIANAAPAGGAAQYEQCLSRAASNPADALREASEWQKAGGGPPSEHCEAVALVALHRYVEAANKLDGLAHGSFPNDPGMRRSLFDQAGNAWLLAGKPDNAIGSFSAALSIDPSDEDVLSDRARADAMKKNWGAAASDLSAALLVNPDRADLLVLRGSALHALGRKKEALADYELALRIRPGYPDALVERGNMKFEGGDIAGARADWSQIVLSSPGSAAAESARQQLAATAPAKPPAPEKPGKPR